MLQSSASPVKNKNNSKLIHILPLSANCITARNLWVLKVFLIKKKPVHNMNTYNIISPLEYKKDIFNVKINW